MRIPGNCSNLQSAEKEAAVAEKEAAVAAKEAIAVSLKTVVIVTLRHLCGI